jgi:hypothetical protein
MLELVHRAPKVASMSLRLSGGYFTEVVVLVKYPFTNA